LSGFSSTAEQFIAASQSAATKRAYASDLKHFFANGGAIPSSPAALAEYLARCAEKLSVATLERRLTSIHKAHLEKSLESPARSETVKRVMQGIRRTLGVKQRQVQPMVKDDLLAALVMIERQKMPIKAARDRALLLVGFASAMRRSELVAVQVEHLTYLANGVEIFLPSSKTDQEAQGRTVFIPNANGERCPVRALAHWLEVSGINEGFVFRAVSRHDRVARHGLSAQSVALVVKASVGRVGGDVTQVSGHSLRAGYCTSAAEKGLQPWQIREQTGHKSDATLAKYIRPIARRKIPSLL
jgi:integrase